MASNEIEIQVKSKDNTKAGFDDSKKSAEAAGDDAGRSWSQKFGDSLRSHLSDLFGGGGSGGSLIGGLDKGLLGGIGPGIAGISALKASLIGLGGAVLGMLPALLGIGAALAVIGGAFAILMKTNKQFANDIKGTWKGIEDTLKEAVTPMIKPLEQGFQQLGAFIKSVGPELKAVFSAAAPLVEPLIHGLTGLVGGILPGLIAVLKAAQPAMQAFGSILAHIGSGIGGMFAAAAPALAASSQLLKGLFGIIDTLLPVLVKLGGTLATALAPAFTALTGAVNAIMPAFGAIGKVIGAFAGAVVGDLAGALSAVATLLKDIAPSLNTLGQALAQVFGVMENSGVFAVFGDALENIAKPLAGLINALVSGIAPALPPIIHLVSEFSSILVTLISAGLDVMISALTAVIQFLHPILPLIVGVVAAIKAWSIVQTVLNVLLDANPIGVIVLALALLIGIIVELVKHWHDVVSVVKTVWEVMKSVITTDMHAIEDVIKTVWDAIKDVFQVVWSFIVDWVRTEVDGIKTILSWFTELAGLFRGWWDDAVNAVKTVVGDLVSFVTGIPRKVLSALGDFGHLLWSAGADLIHGLISGIESAVGGLLSTIGRLAGDVSGAFKSILGIFSPLKVFEQHGRDIVQGLVNGINGASGAATAAMRSLGLAGMPGGGGGAGGAGGAGGGGWIEARLELQPSGNRFMDELMEGAKLWIRTHGGGGAYSVQRALGQGVVPSGG